MADKKNLFEKLIEVRKAVPYLQKENAGYQFKYVSSSQTLGALRGAMDEQGVLLVPKVVSAEVRDHATTKGGHEYFTCLVMEFIWINAQNPEETIVCPWYGQGLDSGEKGVGKAMTYAEKFFMLKFFNIATDQDDPDAFQGKKPGKRKPAKHEPMPSQGKGAPPKEDPKATEPQRRGLFARFAILKATKEQQKDFVYFCAGRSSTSDVTRPEIQEMYQILEGLTEPFMLKDWLQHAEETYAVDAQGE